MQKPGRYVGGELNQVKKDWESVAAHIALVFPDIYDIGLPNLGIMILYEQINQRQDVPGERTYVPWLDMENGDAPAESSYSLDCRWLNLISSGLLPYETLYTNVLNALDLANIPLHSAQRADAHPIILAGGHANFRTRNQWHRFSMFSSSARARK